MKKLLVLLGLLLASPAWAADNYAGTEGVGKTFRCVDVGGVCYPMFIPSNSAGTSWVYGNGATAVTSPRVTIANDNTIPTGWPSASLQAVMTTWAGGTLGAMANYGTSPGAVLVPGVNAFVTNTVTVGTHAVTVASGGIASGAIASGAVASGAIASGAVASGAYASGSIGSGAMVDLGAIADAAATQGSTGTVSAKLRTITSQLNTIATTGIPVTNTNANGSATSANSSPVVIASDQVAVAIKAASGVFASGSFASGSHASGSFASGAFASGSVASGAFASGALASGSVASGAMVDLGAQADSACSTDNGTCSAIALIKRTNQRLTTVNSSIGAANAYETVAASQTAQAMGATGATGDYLSHCVVTPGTTSPGVVTILDNTTAVVSFAGGASSVSNLVSFTIPIGAVSVSGAWKITTGADVTVVCVGRFT